MVQNYAMEALNAVGLTPISVFSDRRTEQRKNLGFHSFPQFKNYPNFTTNSLNLEEGISRSLRGGLAFLSTVLGTGLAKALTYEEALEQSASTAAPTTVDFDAAGVLDSISSFIGENPVVIGGGAVAIVAVPLVISQLLSKPKPWGVESAKTAYAKLSDDAGAQLLDIRPPSELRQVGSPDIRGLKKKPLTIPYKGEDKPGFLKKLSLKIKEPENTTLFVLDKFDGNSELVAELVTANGFKAAYAIRDGAEGSRGWMNSSLPWILPKKSLGLDLGNLTDAIGEGIDSASVALGLAAATGVGLLVFSEAETVLQLLGSAALVQFFSKKLLFAEDRKRTLQQIDEFLQTKVAPEELVDDVKEIGKALLPPTVTSSKALPAATVSSPSSSIPIAESVPRVTDNAPSKAEAVVEPTPDINSVPKAEVEAESVPGIPRPLSPYPNYPDFKPPTSPMPSQP